MPTFEVISAAAIGGGSSSYLVYVAALIQLTNQAPSDGNNGNGFQNTLSGGAVIWTRQGAGVYEGTSTGSFIVGKTHIPYGSNWSGNAFFMMPINDSNTLVGYMSVTISNANVILVQIFNSDISANIDWSTISGGSNIMLPEIRVYP